MTCNGNSLIANAGAPLSSLEKMNLTSLKRRDPYIIRVLDTASQVALYLFNPQDDAWAKTEIEGTLFVYERSAAPFHGFTISNRKMPKNHWETISHHVEFQKQDPFLLYKNKDFIYGMWFFDEKECESVGDLLIQLTKMVQNVDQKDAMSAATAAVLDAANICLGRRSSESTSDKHGIMKEILNDPASPDSPSNDGGAKEGDNDIIALLSKAQKEYDNGQPTRASASPPGTPPSQTNSGCNTVSISVSSLFANAKHQQNQGQVVPKVPVSSLNNSQRKVAILPLMGDGKNESCVAEAEEVPKHCEPGAKGEDALQSFVRKMKINGIQSLDQNLPKESKANLIPRPLSLGMLKNDLNMNTLNGTMDLTGHSTGVPPLMLVPASASQISPRRPSPDHGSSCEAIDEKRQRQTEKSRNAVPSHSPPASQLLPPIPARFTASSSGLCLTETNSESPSSSPLNGFYATPLLTPSAFETTSYSIAGGRAEVKNRATKAKAFRPKVGSSRPAAFFCDEDVLTSADSVGPSSGEDTGTSQTALSRAQLKNTLIEMLKTDSTFVNVIHQGYIKSLSSKRQSSKRK